MKCRIMLYFIWSSLFVKVYAKGFPKGGFKHMGSMCLGAQLKSGKVGGSNSAFMGKDTLNFA